MKLRLFLFIWLLLCVGSSAFAEGRPNIILLMGDDHGWDETGYNGHPHLKTPTLDAMAACGVRLDRFYAAHPSCSPTRGSVMTGRHPNRYGAFKPGCSIRPEEITIAHILSNAGYTCAHFGKWHLGPVKASSPTSPGAMGFTNWLSHDNFFELDPVLSKDGGSPQRYFGESSEILVREAIEFLKEEDQSSKPFFLVIWYGSPHEPYSGLSEDLSLYDDVPELYNDRTFRLTSNDSGLQVVRPLGDVLQERYAEITAMDRSIGQLREWLGQNDLRKNTLLWYCGDNGSHKDGGVTSHLRGHKGSVYEGGVRVPCVIEWPAYFREHRVSQMTAVTSDILPTICELLHLPLPDRPIDGESLVPMFLESRNERVNPICFWDFGSSESFGSNLEPYIDPKLQEGTTPLVKQQGGRYTRNFKNLRITKVDERLYLGPRAILDGQYKLVLDGDRTSPGVELFDLDRDPGEQACIAVQMPERVEELRKELSLWQNSVVASLTGHDYANAPERLSRDERAERSSPVQSEPVVVQ